MTMMEDGNLHELLLSKRSPSVEEVRALIDKHPDQVKTKDTANDEKLPLHVATLENSGIEIVELLLEKYPEGAKTEDRKGKLPLHNAVHKCELDVVEALIDAYPDAVNHGDEDGDLPIYWLVWYNCRIDVLNALLKVDPKGAKEKTSRGLLIHMVIEKHYSAHIVKAILDAYPAGVKARKDGYPPLHLAIKENCENDILRVLLDAYPDGAKVKAFLSVVRSKKYKGDLPLHFALGCKCGVDTAKMLLDYNQAAVKEKDKDGNLPLHIALFSKCGADVAKLVFDAYPEGAGNKNDNEELPLHYALEEKFPPRFLNELYKAYPEAAKIQSRASGKLPLHIAVEKVCELVVVEKLIRVHPEGVKTLNKNGELPLHIAVENKCKLDVVGALLRTHPDGVKTKDNEGRLPLHVAGRCGLDVVKALLEAYAAGAKEKTNEGMLPLHSILKWQTADSKCDIAVVKAVLKAYPHGARVQHDGKLPLNFAFDQSYFEDFILAILQADMPLRSDGTPIEHGGSWNTCVANETDVAVKTVELILRQNEGVFGKHIHALADARDTNNRKALGLASSRSRDIIHEFLLFCRRYKLQIGSPEHRTLTSLVLRAQDLKAQTDYGAIFEKTDKDRSGKLNREELEAVATSIGLNPDLFLKGSDHNEIGKEEFISVCKQQLGDGPREVVIKLMWSKDHWEREHSARKGLNPKYVVTALLDIPSEEEFADEVEKKHGGLDMIAEKFLSDIEIGKHAIVMHAADRNLQQIFYQEQPKIHAIRVILKQVFNAVRYLHQNNLMHGDLKMLNIVRFRVDNLLRLIDFDASAKIKSDNESFAGAKFSSAILPPEMIEKLNLEDVDKFKAYWRSENDEGLEEKVAPKRYVKQGGIEVGQYVVKSFRTDGGNPVFDGLPYDLVEASENIDAWSLGVLAFALLTGEPLFSSTRNDDCATGKDMHLLYTWGKRPEILLERFKKIKDEAARDLVQQLLQREPEKRPSIGELLEKHAFFHPKDTGMMRAMTESLSNVERALESQAKQMEKMNDNLLVIKKLGYESKIELLRTRHALMNGIYEADVVKIPTCFGVFHNKLPELSKESRKKMLDFIADGSGVSFKSKHGEIILSKDGADIALAGDLKKYKEQIDVGIKWAERIKNIVSKVAEGAVGKAFDIMNEGMKDLVVGNEMYFYLIDDLTGEPARGKGWPIVITEPSEVVPKLLPVMVNTMRAMSVLNGTAGLIRMFGFPAPTVPKAWSEGLGQSVKLLKQESSVQDFGVVHKEVKKGTEEKQTVRGASLRDLKDFMEKYDPGLSKGKNGDFAGLQRIGDPDDGTALWTKLTDPKDIERALKDRVRYREEEERSKNEQHSQLRDRDDEEYEGLSEEETKKGVFEEEDIPLSSSQRGTDESIMTQQKLSERDVILTNKRNAFVTAEEIDELIKDAVTAKGEGAAPVTNNVYHVNICSNGCSIM